MYANSLHRPRSHCFIKPPALLPCQAQQTTTAGIPSLKETFKGDFSSHRAKRHAGQGNGGAAAGLISSQFNTATPKNIMKAEVIHPGWDTYKFRTCDKLVEYAQKNGMKVNAHNLICIASCPRLCEGSKTPTPCDSFLPTTSPPWQAVTAEKYFHGCCQ